MIFVNLILLICTGQLSYACIGGSSPASCCRNGCSNTISSGCSSSRPIVNYQTQQQSQVYSQYIAPTYNHGIYAQVPSSYINSGSSHTINNQQYSSGALQQSSNIPHISSQNLYISPTQNQHLQQSQYYNDRPVSQPSYTNNVPVYSGKGENAKGAIYESIQQTVSHEQTQPINTYDSSSNVVTNSGSFIPIQKVETTKETIIPPQSTSSMINSYTHQKVESYTPEEKKTTFIEEKNIITQNYNENIPQINKENLEKTHTTEIETSLPHDDKKIVQVSPSPTHIEDSDYRDQEHEHETVVTSKETIMKTNIVPYTNEVMPPNPPEVESNQLDGKVQTIHVSELPPKGPDYQYQHNEKVYTQEKEEVINQPEVDNKKNIEEIDNVQNEETTINNNNNVIYVSETPQNIKIIQNVLSTKNYETNELSNTLGYDDKTTKQIDNESQLATTIQYNNLIDTTIKDIKNEVKTDEKTLAIGIIPNASETYFPTTVNVNTNTDGSVYEEGTTIKITTSNPIIIEEPQKPYRIRRIYFRHKN